MAEGAQPNIAQSPRELDYYRDMLLIRRFEEMLLDLFDQGVLNGTTHACIGQEANCVGVISNLSDGDHIFSNHRCHGHYLAKTGDAFGLLCEIMGKRSGICGGLGGSQHICAPGFKSNGVQGGIVAAATGIAMAEKLSKSANISVVFIGDGTLGEGLVYECLNIASLWSLPLLIVLEDNGWAQSTPKSLNFSGDIRTRFEGFGVEVSQIDSTDVAAISAQAATAIAFVRDNCRPCALVIHTYRLCHHSKNDDNRPTDEVDQRRLLDPITTLGRRLVPQTRSAIEEEISGVLSAVLSDAQAQP